MRRKDLCFRGLIVTGAFSSTRPLLTPALFTALYAEVPLFSPVKSMIVFES
jgi:hypothetical protein